MHDADDGGSVVPIGVDGTEVQHEGILQAMKKLVVLAGVVAAYVAIHRPEKPKQLVMDRVWMDHLPKSERDPINLFLAFSEDSIGNYVQASRWQGKFELFRFELNGDELRAVFPQTGDKESLTHYFGLTRHGIDVY